MRSTGLQLLLISLISAASTYNSSLTVKDSYDVHSSANTERISLPYFLIKLKNEWSSIFQLNYSEGDDATNHDIAIISKDQMNDRVLDLLGYQGYTKNSKRFILPNDAFNSRVDILVPESTYPIFLFKSSTTTELPINKTDHQYSKFLERQVPFRLPEFSSLDDCFLIVRIQKRFNSNLLDNGIILANSASFPVLRNALNSQSGPLMVFLFANRTEYETKNSNVPLVDVEKDSGLNSYFDTFTKSWVNGLGVNNLLHGLFCTLSTKDLEHSFCLKIKEDLKNVLLLPAFNQNSIRNFPNNSSTLEFRVSNMNRNLILPLSLLAVNPLYGVDGHNSRNKDYSQVVIDLNSDLRTIQKRKLSSLESVKNAAQNYGDKLEERLRYKLKNRRIKDLYINPQYRKARLEHEKGIKVHAQRNADTYAQEFGKSKDHLLADEETVGGDEQPHVEMADNFQPNESLSDNTSDCEEITWFNVFHHSIFGTTKFCDI